MSNKRKYHSPIVRFYNRNVDLSPVPTDLPEGTIVEVLSFVKDPEDFTSHGVYRMDEVYKVIQGNEKPQNVCLSMLPEVFI